MLPGKVQACDEIWVLGDAFAISSFEQYYKERDVEDYKGFTMTTFDVKGFFTNKFTHFDQNTVSRMRNTLIKAITDCILLPKWIFVVFDDDLIKFVRDKTEDYPGNIQDSLERLVSNIMKEHNKAIALQKDFLPNKSQHQKQPQIVWIEAPLHVNFPNNEDRMAFNKALNASAQFHDNTHVLALKKIWDPEDGQLFNTDARRFTSNGYSQYWYAVNRTIKFADTILMKKLVKKGEQSEYDKNFKSTKFIRRSDKQDRFHWSNTSQSSHRRKLPSPYRCYYFNVPISLGYQQLLLNVKVM